MIVVFSAEAEADLERIGDHIARDDPRRAITFVAELIDRCERLSQTPEGYPLVPRYAASGIRRHVHGRYLIFYRVTTPGIAVLHIVHGAQDYEAILFPAT